MQRTRTVRLGVLVATAVWALAAGGSALAATTTVVIRGNTYAPADITIAAGDALMWRNEDPVAHTVRLDTGGWDSGPIAAGATQQATFTAPGRFGYGCSVLPEMRGTINVTEAGAAPAPQPTPVVPPPTDTLATGGGASAGTARVWLAATLAAIGLLVLASVSGLAQGRRRPALATVAARTSLPRRWRMPAPSGAGVRPGRVHAAVGERQSGEHATVTGTAPWAMTIPTPTVEIPATRPVPPDAASDREGAPEITVRPMPPLDLAASAVDRDATARGSRTPGVEAVGAATDEAPRAPSRPRAAGRARASGVASPRVPSFAVLVLVLAGAIAIGALLRRGRD